MIIDTSGKMSWHQELYDVGGGELSGTTNLCTYTRRVIQGGMWSLVVVGIGVLVGVLFLEPVLSTALWLHGNHGFQPFFMNGELIWGIDAMIGLFASVAFVCSVITSWNSQRKQKKRHCEEAAGVLRVMEPKEPGYLTMVYRSIKEKTCFIIEFKDVKRS